MKKSVILGCLVAAALSASCVKETPDTPSGEITGKEITLSLEFETQTSVEKSDGVATKTYLNKNKQILWGTSDADKVIYVFDTKGAKNAFDGSEGAAVNQTSREFVGNVTEGSVVDYVIWTGQTASADNCELNNGVFSGATVKVANSQTVSNDNSFAQTANIAVMKPGDTALRNVFGYIQYTLPEGIESVTFTATENIAGLVEIDYTGVDPVATLTGESASKSIKVKTKYKDVYVAGTYYAVLPAGTYTNLTIAVKPVDGESFTLTSKNDVVIVRGKYTSAGTLPATAPEQTEPDPEPEPDDSNWPNDETAFDYGLTGPKTASYDVSALEAIGVVNESGKRTLSTSITMDKMTYAGPGVDFYGDRFYLNTAFNYIDDIPTQRYISFKINKPGTLSFFPRYSSVKTPNADVTVRVVMKKNGVYSSEIVYTVSQTNVTILELYDSQCRV